MIEVFPIPALRDNYIWCIHNQTHCAIVDPGESTPVLEQLKDSHLELCAILITHHHYDHTNGIKELLQFKQVPVFGASSIDFINHPVSEASVVNIHELNLSFKVLTVPGHTLEHIAYFTNDLVFTGDTLFTAGCGKIFEGTVQQMYDSLEKLKSLPDTTSIYCGHEYTESNLQFAIAVEPENTTIIQRIEDTQVLRKNGQPTVPATLDLEKKTNPFLRCDQPAVLMAASNYCGEILSDPIQVLKILREWKNKGEYPH